jgi:hypothetical protein
VLHNYHNATEGRTWASQILILWSSEPETMKFPTQLRECKLDYVRTIARSLRLHSKKMEIKDFQFMRSQRSTHCCTQVLSSNNGIKCCNNVEYFSKSCYRVSKLFEVLVPSTARQVTAPV